MTHETRTIVAALAVLIILQIVMLSALYASVAPHPPATTPLFGIAPFVGASVSIAIAAIIIGPLQSGAGRILCVIAITMALISFGPQKFLDPQFGLIWPAVLVGQLATIVVAVSVINGIRHSTG